MVGAFSYMRAMLDLDISGRNSVCGRVLLFKILGRSSLGLLPKLLRKSSSGGEGVSIAES